MLRNLVPFVLLLISFFSFCNEGPRQKTALPVADTAKYYPCADFIREQIRFVDLRNFDIRRTLTVDSRKDSSAITKDAFLGLANGILTVLENWNKQKYLYKETVFQDLSTNSYTINYTATDPDAKLQRIDILLNDKTNAIKRMFLRENWKLNDTVYTNQFSWLADQGFQIVSAKNYQELSHSQTIAVDWNKPLEK
ncbi:MAG: hypothetical protein PHD73_03965 [Sediminibacterium sp.]|nr:hypothetical protein [Sediminibacterium sp.]